MRERPIVANMVNTQRLPRMFRVKQIFPRPKIDPEAISSVIDGLLSCTKFEAQIKPGMRIAITAGSRGIANIALVTRTVVDFVKKQGACPFIVPTMGSHGGASAEGQTEILASYDITEESMGCPIVSSMEVTKIGVNEEGMDVFIDKNAHSADGIIVVGRIKPHTCFRGSYESGLMKMMAIGLGKQYGAEVCHEAGFKNMAKYVPMFGRAILQHANILFAVGLIENAFDETCKIVAMNADEIETEEPILLQEAFANMPRIWVDACDVLIVDKIGKNYSGDGMDPNITGTFCSPYASGGLNAQRTCVLDLSDETHGNGIGIGMADATTRRAFEKLDLSAMYPNAITSTVVSGVSIPMIMESDKETIQLCVKICNEIDKEHPRIVRIPNSLHVGHIWLSESFYEEAKNHTNMVIESDPAEFDFDEEGNLW